MTTLFERPRDLIDFLRLIGIDAESARISICGVTVDVISWDIPDDFGKTGSDDDLESSARHELAMIRDYLCTKEGFDFSEGLSVFDAVRSMREDDRPDASLELDEIKKSLDRFSYDTDDVGALAAVDDLIGLVENLRSRERIHEDDLARSQKDLEAHKEIVERWKNDAKTYEEQLSRITPKILRLEAEVEDIRKAFEDHGWSFDPEFYGENGTTPPTLIEAVKTMLGNVDGGLKAQTIAMNQSGAISLLEKENAKFEERLRSAYTENAELNKTIKNLRDELERYRVQVENLQHEKVESKKTPEEETATFVSVRNLLGEADRNLSAIRTHAKEADEYDPIDPGVVFIAAEEAIAMVEASLGLLGHFVERSGEDLFVDGFKIPEVGNFSVDFPETRLSILSLLDVIAYQANRITDRAPGGVNREAFDNIDRSAEDIRRLFTDHLIDCRFEVEPARPKPDPVPELEDLKQAFEENRKEMDRELREKRKQYVEGQFKSALTDCPNCGLSGALVVGKTKIGGREAESIDCKVCGRVGRLEAVLTNIEESIEKGDEG